VKKTVYIDVDNVLVDTHRVKERLTKSEMRQYKDRLPMEPIEDAIGAFKVLEEYFDVYVLSMTPRESEAAWDEKLAWVKTHLGDQAHKRMILASRKNLNKGDFLVDDQKKYGVKDFKCEHIYFGRARFKTWKSVLRYLLANK